MKPKRPLLVTLASLILMLLGLGGFVALLLNGYSGEQQHFVASQCGIAGFVAKRFGSAGWNAYAGGIYFLAAITGLGLWRLLPWARTTVIVFSLLTICSGIVQSVQVFYTHTCTSADLTMPLLSCVLLGYFARKKIRCVFFRPLNEPTVTFQ